MKKASDYRTEARSALANNWGTAIGIFFIYALILGAVSFTLVGTIILGGPLLVGIITFYTKLLNKENGEVGDLFNGFKTCFGGAILTNILVSIFTFCWSLLFFIPGLIKMFSYSMAMYIQKDNPQMSSTECITQSREIMNGNKWRLFCLRFSFIGWIILVGITFGIAIFWVAPYMQAAEAAFYEDIKQQDMNNITKA